MRPHVSIHGWAHHLYGPGNEQMFVLVCVIIMTKDIGVVWDYIYIYISPLVSSCPKREECRSANYHTFQSRPEDEQEAYLVSVDDINSIVAYLGERVGIQRRNQHGIGPAPGVT